LTSNKDLFFHQLISEENKSCDEKLQEIGLQESSMELKMNKISATETDLAASEKLVQETDEELAR
jgi:hypothetical protein